jgi:hypothetical protein
MQIGDFDDLIHIPGSSIECLVKQVEQGNHQTFVRGSEVLREVKMSLFLFWVITQNRLADRPLYRRFGETY